MNPSEIPEVEVVKVEDLMRGKNRFLLIYSRETTGSDLEKI